MVKSGVKRPDARTSELDEKLTNNMVAALWAGASLMASIIILTALGGTGLFFGRDLGGAQGAKIGLVVGLAVGVTVLSLLLYTNAPRIRARSENLYRGMWFGMILAVVLLLIMAFAPELLGAAPAPGTDPTGR